MRCVNLLHGANEPPTNGVTSNCGADETERIEEPDLCLFIDCGKHPLEWKYFADPSNSFAIPPHDL